MTVWYDPSSTTTPTFANGWSVFNQTTLSALLDSTSNLALGTAAAAPSTLAVLGSTGTNNVKNGSFETGLSSSDWVAKDAATPIVDASAVDGKSVLRLGAGKSGEVAQSITTQANSVYTLIFTAASVSAATQKLKIELNGVTANVASPIEARSFDIVGLDRKTYTFTFRALSDLTTLKFSALSGDGLNVDNVRMVKTGESDFNFITNGDFETGATGPGQAEGWSIEANAGVSTTAGRATTGTGFLALGGWSNGAGAVYQTIGTKAGAIYSLSYAVKSYSTAQNYLFSICAMRNGIVTYILTDTMKVNGALRMNYTFMAQSASTRLRFKVDGSSGDLDLDDVRITEMLGGDDKLGSGDLEGSDSASGQTSDTSLSSNDWALDAGASIVTANASAASGDNFLALGYNTTGTGSALQTLDTRAGTFYSLSFSANASGTAQSATVDIQSIDMDGNLIASVFTKTTTISTGGYKAFSVTFKATSDLTLVKFTTAASAGDLFIDDVCFSRVGGKEDTFSDAAGEINPDAYIASSAVRLAAAVAALGASFTDGAQRRWWALERFDGGLDTDTRMFDERAYFALNQTLTATWTGTALDHYLTIGRTTTGIVVPIVSAAALALDADLFLAGSAALITAADKALGGNLWVPELRAYWVRTWFDTHPASQEIDYFDADTYSKMYPDLPTFWTGLPEEHFIMFGKNQGFLLPLNSMGASTLDPDAYLYATPGLADKARAELGTDFDNEVLRQAWTLRYYVSTYDITVINAGLPPTPNYFDPPGYYDHPEDDQKASYLTTKGFEKVVSDLAIEMPLIQMFPLHGYTHAWFKMVVSEFVDCFKNDEVYANWLTTYPTIHKDIETIRNLALAVKPTGMDLTAFIGTLDGSADAALKRMMPYICSMCANLLYLADYVAEAAVKITGETLFKPDVNRNIESILGYTSFNSTMADALSVYQDNLRAYPLFTALKGMTRVLNVTDANPMTEDRVARRFGNESSLRRRLTNVFLSSWNIKKGTNVYNQYARLVIGWIEATISKVTLIYLRVLNVGAHAGSATMMGGAFKSFIELFQQHPTLSLPGRAIPASAMLAITIGTLLGNAGSRYSSTSGAGIARTVALALYGMGSMVRLGGLAVESLAIRSFQAWIQGGAFFRAVAESPAAEAIIAKTLMVNKGPVAFGRVFIKDMLRAAGSRGASFLQETQLYNAISRYNSALSLISSNVYKRVMGGFFASADIVVSVQNVLDSVAKFQNGKPVGGALYAATAGFNFASGACGLLALMAAAHPVMAATLTASVLVCSIISLTTNIAALLVDS